MRRCADSPVIQRCEHTSPVLVVEFEHGKIAHCLMCGESGPVREGSQSTLLALKDRVPRREVHTA